MKKFVKISLITAGILFLAGCLLGTIGIIGGKRQLARFISEEVHLEEKVVNLMDSLDDLGEIDLEISDEDWEIRINSDGADALTVNGEVVSEKTTEGKETQSESTGVTVKEKNGNWYQVSADSIRKLNLELGAGTFTVKEKETADGIIEMQFEGLGNCNYYVEDDTLHIEGFKGFVLSNGGGANQIVVKVPQGSQFDEVDAEIGAGLMTLKNLKVGELETKVGAGELEMSNMEAEKLSSEIGAGQLTISETVVNHVDLSISMGECIFDGTIKGNLEAECDMGNLELSLTGKETEHNYEIECAAGDVEIGDFGFSGLATEKNVDNNVASTFDINCNMGSIVIEFEE